MDSPGVIQSGDFELQSSSETPDEMRQALTQEEAPSAPAGEPDSAEAPAAAPAIEPTTERDEKTGQFAKRPTNAEARKDPKARLAQQTFDQREAERRAEAAEKRAEAAERRAQELETRQRPAEPPPAKPQPRAETYDDPNDPEPNPEDLTKYADGQFDRKYLRDLGLWSGRQAQKQADYHRELSRRQEAAQQAEDAQRKALVERANTFNERFQAAKKTNPTIEDQIHPKLLEAWPTSALPPDQRARPTFANWVAEQVLHADHPAELLLHLSNDAEAQRLATLLGTAGELAAIRELATLDVRLGAAPPAASAPKAEMSHAKPPIQPLGSSPHAADPTELSEDLPIEEWIKRANAKERQAGRR
jgi:hypothetical protein